jgi:hypothetical protein
MRPNWSVIKRFALAVVCALAIGAAGGQAINSGDIRGTVTDSTGALLPDVTVTVVNVNTGVTKVLTTNHDGLYDTSSIVVGTYTVTFEKQGFEKFERSSITLEVGTSTVNAALKVGSTSEEVVVNTDLPLLDTESGAQQTTFEAKSMAALANVGQDWENFTILLPGTSGANAGNAQNQVNPGQVVSANGNLPYSNVLADGATSTLSHSQNSNVDVFENVAELQISDSAFSAQYGVGGIIFNQISKGGTSKFHGTGYDYFQSSQFDSLGYNYSGSKETVPYQRYNNFGGSIGGPVAIPFTKLRDKAFFYFNYDQIVDHGAGSNNTNSIPTTTVMGGDFTGEQLIYDPTTQTIGTDANGNPYPIRKSFLSEYGTNAVPTALFDKVAANFQQYYPTPTNHISAGHFITGNTITSGSLVGVTQNNFIASVPNSTPYRKYFGRFDYDITSRNRLTMSIQQSDTPVIYPSAVTVCPIGCQSGDVDNYVSQVSDVWTISPKVINEVRLGYTYQGNFFADLALGTGQAAKLGWTAAKADDFPAIQFVTNYPYAWIEPSSNAVYKEHVFDPSDVVTMIRGKHVLHFGGEFAFYQDNSTAWGNTNAGTYQFSGQYTQQWTLNSSGVASPNTATGVDYADFLLGYAQNWSASISPEYGARIKDPQVFIQDDYKIRPNFTLNIGLRYQIRHGWSEVHNNEAIYDPTVNNPANNTPGAYWYGTTHANGRTQLESNKYDTVLPRVGFSWLVRPSMTLRGGFGEYAYNLSLDTYGGGMGAEIAASGNYADTTNGITPATQLGGPGTIFGTTTPLPYSAASTSPTRFNGQSVSYTQYNTPNPGIYQWNLGIQQTIGNNMVFDLAYVASHGFNLQFVTDLNQIPTADLSTNDKKYAPNPNFQQINGSINNGISNYNSMQAQLNRRLSHGVSFGFNYTWSHMLDTFDSSGWGSRNGPTSRQYADAPSNYSNSNFDIRNAFKGRVVYELPFGKGRQFMNHNWLLDEVLGGYQVSSTMQLTSGNPFSIFAEGANTYADIGASNAPYPNYVGSGHALRGVPGGRNAYEWYNPANFTLPASGTFGNVRRNALYGPGLDVFNISAGKYFDIHESMKLQIRLDANNAFNHGSLGQPNGNLTQSPGVGQPYTGNGTGGTNTIQSGQITGNKVNGRQVQAGVRLEF